MLELSILDLLYLVLTFFLVVIGSLLSLVLLRLLKILAVGVEIANYYWGVKRMLLYYSQVPFVVKEKIFEYFSGTTEYDEEQKQKDPIEK